VSEEVNRKLRARNALVQRLALHTDRERHNAQRYRRTDGRTYRQTIRQTDRQTTVVTYVNVHDANQKSEHWRSQFRKSVNTQI